MPELALAPLPHVAASDLAAMIAPERTALVVVDVQTDFAAADGLVGRYGADMTTIPPAIDRIEALIAAARAAGAAVAFLRVVTRAETDSVAMRTLMERRGMAGGEAICRADSVGADYHRVLPQPGDIEIAKLMFNGFHATDFDERLRAHGVDTLLMTGFTTDCCVDATARDAFHRDYHVFIVSDACGAYEPDLQHGALNALNKNCALLVESDAVLAAWTA